MLGSNALGELPRLVLTSSRDKSCGPSIGDGVVERSIPYSSLAMQPSRSRALLDQHADGNGEPYPVMARHISAADRQQS